MPLGDQQYSDTGIKNLVVVDDHDNVYQKLFQSDVAYRKSADNIDACEKCRFFIEPSSCKRVEGYIERDYTCDLFEKKTLTKELVDKIISKFISQ